MLDSALRPLKDRLLGPPARALAPRIGAGAVTAAGLGAGLAAAALAWRGWYLAALALWLINRLLDGIDGIVARERRTMSDRGGYLDLLCDFLVYALIPIGIASGRPEAGAYVPVAWLLGSFYVNAMSWLYIAAVLERRGEGARRSGAATSIAMPEGVVGGTETLLFYSAFLVFPGQFRPLMLAMAVLTAAGAAQRTVWAWRRL